jgi:hypothetical protein
MKAQDIQPVPISSLPNADDLYTFSDSLRKDSTLLLKGDSVYLAVDTAGFRPNPKRAILFSAIIPGLGQIYNRKYWKLPLVYGGFIGCAYAITWNNTQYTGYRRAFIDFLKDPANTDSWRGYASSSYPADINDWTDQQKTQFSSRLQAQKNYYRYYRDMSVIVTVGVYALCIVDAYVDAQLFDFDVSPDLSMRAAPVFFEKTPVNSRSYGLQLSFTF